MRDLEESFGKNAGKIWEILNKNNQLSKENILKKTKLREIDFYTGLGWLAKENKVFKLNEDEFKLGFSNLDEKIGTNAGKVWKVMDIWGEVDISTISRLAYIDKQDVYAALGWLAREDKICNNENDKYNLK